MSKKWIRYAMAVIGAVLLGYSFTVEPSFTQTIVRILSFVVPGLNIVIKEVKKNEK